MISVIPSSRNNHCEGNELDEDDEESVSGNIRLVFTIAFQNRNARSAILH